MDQNNGKERKLTHTMPAVFRQTVAVGTIFEAPHNITFGYQEARTDFSFWYVSGDSNEATQPHYKYLILGTGHPYPGKFELVSSFVMADGFHVFHLCRLL
jgi:hypothetical protein